MSLVPLGAGVLLPAVVVHDDFLLLAAPATAALVTAAVLVGRRVRSAGTRARALADRVAAAEARVRACDHLESRQARLAALAHHSDEMITVFGPGGRVVHDSPAVARILAPPPDATSLAQRLALVHPADRPHVAAALHAVGADGPAPGGSRSVEARVRNADGEWRWCEATVVDRGDDPTVAGLVVTLRDIDASRRLADELSSQALRDQGTGLANRALVDDRLQQAFARAARHDRRVAVIVVAVQSPGQAAPFLTEIGRRLENLLRGSDTLGRAGDDELVVVLDGVASLTEAQLVAERCRAAAREPVVVDGKEQSLNASVGLAITDDDSGVDGLLRNAATASRVARRCGDDTVRTFDPSMHAGAGRRLDAEEQLRRALERNELAVVYQPAFDAGTGALVSAEALVRWPHPSRGLLLPEDFLTVAGDMGLLPRVATWVLGEACRALHSWRQVAPGMRVSVNLWPSQLAAPGLVDDVAAALDAVGAPPAALVLELAEASLLDDDSVGHRALTALDRLGVRLSVDDFGTGFSSLGSLARFPLDEIKIDTAFVTALGGQEQTTAVVRAMIGMAHALTLTTVAEGVETEDQLTILRALGCDVVSGGLFAAPQAAGEVLRLLRHQHEIRRRTE